MAAPSSPEIIGTASRKTENPANNRSFPATPNVIRASSSANLTLPFSRTPGVKSTESLSWTCLVKATCANQANLSLSVRLKKSPPGSSGSRISFTVAQSKPANIAAERGIEPSAFSRKKRHLPANSNVASTAERPALTAMSLLTANVICVYMRAPKSRPKSLSKPSRVLPRHRCAIR